MKECRQIVARVVCGVKIWTLLWFLIFSVCCGVKSEYRDKISMLKSECELSSIPSCEGFKHGWIRFPNIFGHVNQLQVKNSSELRFLLDLADELKKFQVDPETSGNFSVKDFEKCVIQIHQLYCSLLTPKCHYIDFIRSNSPLPGRGFCQDIVDRCRPVVVERGMRWPDHVSCTSLQVKDRCTKHDKNLNFPEISRRLEAKIRKRKQNHHYLKNSSPVDASHHSFASMKRTFRKLSRACSDIIRIYTIGKSVKKRHLLVIEISDHPGVHEVLEPELKWVAGIHGNEVVGREVSIAFAQYLCQEWIAGNDRIQRLIRNTRIHILPNMNPDGYYQASLQKPNRRDWLTGRWSSKYFDLNRSFPHLNQIMYEREKNGGANHHIPIPSAFYRRYKQKFIPEVYAIIEWLKHYPFVLSAQLHGGALLANYPYDLSRSTKSRKYPKPEYTSCPDDDVFRMLASTYAQNHKTMSNQTTNKCSPNIAKQKGITNGAAWYSVNGGMQDFNYLHTNCFELTFELGCSKFPRAQTLSRHWMDNKDALLNFSEKVHIGIKGLVRNRRNRGIKGAIIHVHGIAHDITTTHLGEYWRLLVPGVYKVIASHPRYQTQSKKVKVVEGNDAVLLNFTLRKRRKRH